MNGIEARLIAKEELRYTRDEINAFLSLLVALSPRELEVLRFSLLGLTQTNIGKIIGLSQQRVSQIYHAALVKLFTRALTV
jgi:RNA polymerase sigma factor (sigma-70 family)